VKADEVGGAEEVRGRPLSDVKVEEGIRAEVAGGLEDVNEELSDSEAAVKSEDVVERVSKLEGSRDTAVVNEIEGVGGVGDELVEFTASAAGVGGEIVDSEVCVTDVVEEASKVEVSGEDDEVGGEIFGSEDVMNGEAVEDATKIEVSGVEEVTERSVSEAEGVSESTLGVLDDADVVDDSSKVEVDREIYGSEDVVNSEIVEDVTTVEVSGVGVEDVTERSVVSEAEGVSESTLEVLDEADVVEEAR